jgi:hypothetical protein
MIRVPPNLTSVPGGIHLAISGAVALLACPGVRAPSQGDGHWVGAAALGGAPGFSVKALSTRSSDAPLATWEGVVAAGGVELAKDGPAGPVKPPSRTKKADSSEAGFVGGVAWAERTGAPAVGGAPLAFRAEILARTLAAIS